MLHVQSIYIQNLQMTLQQEATRALEIAGNKHKYQFIIMLILCVIFYFDVFLLLGPSFYFMDPTFICDGSDEVVDEKVACGKIAECHITNSFTITKYMGLYCDRQGERDLIQSMLSVGSLLGLVIMNIISDLKGRRLALIADMIIATLSALLTMIGAYAHSTFLLTVASVMAGFSGYSLVIICYIIAGDICEEVMRQKSSLYMNVSYSLGLITFFFMYNWINEWYNIIVLFMLLPFLGLTFVSFILVEESPNYYLCKKHNKKKCIDTLVNIACHNKKSQEDIEQIYKTINNADLQQRDSVDKTNKSVFQVLKQWKYLKIIIFVAITESGGNLFFYGIQYAIDDIGFNYGVDNLVLGSTQIITTLILTNFVSKLNRRKTLVLAYLFTVGVALVFLFDSVAKSDIICTGLIILIRASTTLGYFMIVMIQTQSFPLEIQSIGAGTIEAFAQTGSIAAPLIITFAIDEGWEKMATMGALMLICLIPIKFVPQPKRDGEIEEKGLLKDTLLESQVQ